MNPEVNFLYLQTALKFMIRHINARAKAFGQYQSGTDTFCILPFDF